MKINDVFESDSASYQIKRFDHDHLYASKMDLKLKDGKQTLVAVKGRPRKFTKLAVAAVMGEDPSQPIETATPSSSDTASSQPKPNKVVSKSASKSVSKPSTKNDGASKTTKEVDDELEVEELEELEEKVSAKEPAPIEAPKRDPEMVERARAKLAESLGLEGSPDEDW